MENKKFKLTSDTANLFGRTLFRIKALVSFGDVVAGTLGGYVEKEENLSHEGDAWIYDDAKVCENARIFGNAIVRGNTKVYGNAKVHENSEIWGDAEVRGDAEICGSAEVSGDTTVHGNAKIYGNADVYGNTEIGGNAKIYEDAEIYECAEIYGSAEICGNAEIYGRAKVYENAEVYGGAEICGIAEVGGNAQIYGNAEVCGEAIIWGDAKVRKRADYLCFRGLGSNNRHTTFFKCKDGHICVICGCFNGTLEEFERKVKETHKSSKFAKEYLTCIEAVKIHFDIEKYQVERILCAAIKIDIDNKPIIISGYRHSNCMDIIRLHYPNYSVKQSQQGFLTSTGRYVDRKKAKLIAIEANQLIQDLGYDKLFSEELYELY